MVTELGKFVDPLADKLLVCSALICLVEMGKIPSWIVIIIISREFIISGFRLVASDNGVVIAASYWGKFKTHLPDGDDYPDDCRYPGTFPGNRNCDVDCIDTHGNFTGRLSG